MLVLGSGPRNCLEPPSPPSRIESELAASLPAPCWLLRLFSALRWAHALLLLSPCLRPTGQPGPVCSRLPWGATAHRQLPASLAQSRTPATPNGVQVHPTHASVYPAQPLFA